MNIEQTIVNILDELFKLHAAIIWQNITFVALTN